MLHHSLRYWKAVFVLLLGITLVQAAPLPETQESHRQIKGQLMKLSIEQQHLARCAALLSLGDQQHLATAIQAALDDGIPINTLKDSFVQLYAYTGFPRSLNALATLMNVVNTRKQAGKKDIEGEATPIPPQIENAQQDGEKVQTELVGRKVEGALFDFAPAIAYYLQSHLFGDIFSSPILDWQSREIVTVSAIVAIDGADSQLQSHIAVSRHNQISDAALVELANILAEINPILKQRMTIVLSN